MSLPSYAAYRPSGIEWMLALPNHWSLSSIKRCSRLMTERATTRSNAVALENIQSWTGRILASGSTFEGDGVAFAPNDILFGKLRPYLAKVYLAETHGEAVGDFHVLRPDKSIHPRFMQYTMLTREFIDVVDGSTFGSKMPRASWESLGGMPLCVPPVEEQHAIASFLDRETAKIDALVAEQKQLVELLLEQRDALISHSVTKGLAADAPLRPTGNSWLGSVPAHWQVAGLTKYLEPVVDYRGRTPTKTEDGIPLITARNIRSGRIDYEASREFVEAKDYDCIMSRGRPVAGDVLFTTEAPLGQVANVDDPHIALAQRVIKFRGQPRVVNNFFLKYWLMGAFSQAEMVRLATGSTALGIKGSKVGQLTLCVPPYDEQATITRFLDAATSRLDELAAEAERGRNLLQERRGALISAAVTGQIDVRGLVAA